MVTIIDEWWMRLIAGLIGSSLISYAAYRKQSLSTSGMWSAIIMGTSFVVFGEPIWFVLLGTFFITSTFWSKWKRNARQKARAEGNYEKSGRRDWGQVWANGGFGLLLCVVAYFYPYDGWLYAYIGVMASVTADTWATEIGALSQSRPFSVVTFKAVEVGTSGGISALGLFASFIGAACIGLVASLFIGHSLMVILTSAVAGFAGALLDSYMGATCQVMYRCQVCGHETERKIHCHKTTVKVRGLASVNNDIVNVSSSLMGGCIALILLVILL